MGFCIDLCFADCTLHIRRDGAAPSSHPFLIACRLGFVRQACLPLFCAGYLFADAGPVAQLVRAHA